MRLRLVFLLLLAVCIHHGAAAPKKPPPGNKKPPPSSSGVQLPPPQASPSTSSKPPPSASSPPPASSGPSTGPKNILELASAQLDCRSAVRLFKNPRFPLMDILSSRTDALTFFLPTDSALQLYLQVLGVDNTAELNATFPAAQIINLMAYHLVPGAALPTKQLETNKDWATQLPGYTVNIRKEGQNIFLRSSESKAMIVRSNLRAGNSILHVIDRVLVPYDLYEPPKLPSYSSLAQAASYLQLNTTVNVVAMAQLWQVASRSDLVGTVFLPTDQGWTALQSAIEVLVSSGAISPMAVAALFSAFTSNATIVARVLGDHFHFGEALSAADLSTRTSLTVGLDPTQYGTPGASSLLLSVTPSGALRLSGLTSAVVTQPDIYACANAGLAIHLINGVLISNQTARALGLLGAASSSPLPSPRPSPLLSPRPSPLPSPPSGGVKPTIMDLLAADSRLSQLLALSKLAVNIPSVLNNPANVLTFFAPTDTALAALPRQDLLKLHIDSGVLAAIVIGDHIHLTEKLRVMDLAKRSSLAMGLNSSSYAADRDGFVAISPSGKTVSLTGVLGAAKVITADVGAGKAVMHVVDSVIVTVRTAKLLGFIPSPASSSSSPPPPQLSSPPPPPPVSSPPPPPETPVPSPSPPPPPALPSVIEVNAAYDSLVQAFAGYPGLTILKNLYTSAASSYVGSILIGLLAGPYTVMAPTDDAFNAYLAATGKTLAQVTSDPLSIAPVILPHIDFDDGGVTLDAMTDGRVLQMGYPLLVTSRIQLTVRRSGSSLTLAGPVNSVNVVASRISVGALAQMHIVDGVILAS